MIVSLVAITVTIAVGLVAIIVSLRLANKSEQSLTKIEALVEQINRDMHEIYREVLLSLLTRSDVTIRSLRAQDMRDSVAAATATAENIAGAPETKNSEEKENGKEE